jgi:hypothetical protein
MHRQELAVWKKRKVAGAYVSICPCLPNLSVLPGISFSRRELQKAVECCT